METWKLSVQRKQTFLGKIGLIFNLNKYKKAARCHELVPTAPSRPEGDTWQVMSRPHIPKWYEGDAELANDWAAEQDYDSEEILMGDQ